MKVGIITIPDFDNYGNRLQNYALQKAIEKTGHNAVSYVPFRPVYVKFCIKQLLHSRLYDFRDAVLKIRRMKKFLKFDSSYVNTKAVNTAKFENELAEQCDFFVAGSDQIWNPSWAESLFENMFLRFAGREQKIAYAPSFGVDMIPEKWVGKYADGLKDFQKLSVREDRGANMVKEIADLDVPVVLDPTMLLTTDEWVKVAKLPTGISQNEKYVLTYFLGEISDDGKAFMEALKEKHNIKVLNLLDKEDKMLYGTGPSEFLGLIQNAQLVLTDSFHASVFSIIFERPFTVFPRKGMGAGMGSRIATLLEKFNLEHRLYPNMEESSVFDMSYLLVKEILEKEREKSYLFLSEALSSR